MKNRSSKPLKEQIKHWQPLQPGRVELLHAAYTEQTFAKHCHDNYAVGVIETGALAFRYKGENLVAAPGQICLVIPGESHDGHAAANQGWTYRMFYLEQSVMRQAAAQLSDKATPLPYFRPGVIQDCGLAGLIHRTHHRLEATNAPLLEKESRLMEMLTRFLIRHADPAPVLNAIGDEHRSVSHAIHYIEDNYAEDISVKALAAVAHMSPYHFIRVFKAHTGLSPHAYLMQARTRRAKQRLLAGAPILDCALETGFADQSHLNRHFKRTYGITPGQYRNSIQDNSLFLN